MQIMVEYCVMNGLERVMNGGFIVNDWLLTNYYPVIIRLSDFPSIVGTNIALDECEAFLDGLQFGAVGPVHSMSTDPERHSQAPLSPCRRFGCWGCR